VVSAKPKFSASALFDRAQHHLDVVGHGFAGFEMARAMTEAPKEDQHPVHPREISAPNADAGHASAMWQRDLKPITDLAILGHHQKPLTPFYGHGHRQRIRA
jgi:hypothetical protein